MRPIDEMYNIFAFDIETADVFRAMEEWLHTYYPEATWRVNPSERGVAVSVEFNSPEEQSFYMLKWA